MVGSPHSEFRALRKVKQLSQEQVAVQAGISSIALRNLEQGKSVHRSTFLSVCRVLNVDPGEFEGRVKLYNPWDHRKRKA